jgi:hypothetical protein
MNNYFWFEPSFDEKLKEYILAHQLKNASLACQVESARWANKLLKYNEQLSKDEEYTVEVHEGMYVLESGEQEGHTWLVIDGNIFDPTAAQFAPQEIDNMDYEIHLIHEEDDLLEWLE